MIYVTIFNFLLVLLNSFSHKKSGYRFESSFVKWLSLWLCEGIISWTTSIWGPSGWGSARPPVKTRSVQGCPIVFYIPSKYQLFCPDEELPDSPREPYRWFTLSNLEPVASVGPAALHSTASSLFVSSPSGSSRNGTSPVETDRLLTWLILMRLVGVIVSITVLSVSARAIIASGRTALITPRLMSQSALAPLTRVCACRSCCSRTVGGLQPILTGQRVSKVVR